ncbi:hypothetical protein BAAM1489_03930 [Bifidobacterium animalis subsp. animalis MCC 1489]|nr:hypothetical protein BAAM1489_03930 [Bifidobacterium animalis subsp. animalis MCC 1489]
MPSHVSLNFIQIPRRILIRHPAHSDDSRILIRYSQTTFACIRVCRPTNMALSTTQHRQSETTRHSRKGTS